MYHESDGLFFCKATSGIRIVKVPVEKCSDVLLGSTGPDGKFDEDLFDQAVIAAGATLDHRVDVSSFESVVKHMLGGVPSRNDHDRLRAALGASRDATRRLETVMNGMGVETEGEVDASSA